MNYINSLSNNILTESLSLKIDAVLENFGNDATRLIGILLEVQNIVPKQFIPKEIAVYIGEKIDVPLSRVYDVIVSPAIRVNGVVYGHLTSAEAVENAFKRFRKGAEMRG